MSESNRHLDEIADRYRQALKSYLAKPELIAALTSEVDAFFTRHPDLVRSPLAEQFIGALVLERILNAALSAGTTA